MPARTQADYEEMLGRAGRHWGWVLAFGIITLAAGLAVLAWPGRTLVVIAVLFGIQLIVAGIFRFVAAFTSDDLPSAARFLVALLGVLTLIIGLYAVRHALITVLALALLLGIFWIVNGVIELLTVLSHRKMDHRGWAALMGALSAAAGLIVLAYPGISLLVLAIVLSIWLVIFGGMEIILAIQLRSAATRRGRVVRTPRKSRAPRASARR